VVSQPL